MLICLNFVQWFTTPASPNSRMRIFCSLMLAHCAARYWSFLRKLIATMPLPVPLALAPLAFRCSLHRACILNARRNSNPSYLIHNDSYSKRCYLTCYYYLILLCNANGMFFLPAVAQITNLTVLNLCFYFIIMMLFSNVRVLNE